MLLKCVSHYDLSVPSMSVMGFQKKVLIEGLGGWDDLCPVCFGSFGILQNHS